MIKVGGADNNLFQVIEVRNHWLKATSYVGAQDAFPKTDSKKCDDKFI